MAPLYYIMEIPYYIVYKNLISKLEKSMLQ